MRRPIEAAQAGEYLPDIQAFLKRPAAAYLGQKLLETDIDEGWIRIGYTLSDPHFNRYGTIHGSAIACVMNDVVATAVGLVA